MIPTSVWIVLLIAISIAILVIEGPFILLLGLLGAALGAVIVSVLDG